VATNPRHNLGDDEEVLPLLFAKQVEFLRGPASALYGVGP
jgi:outer membrane receptor protein involved in Fe transport